MNRFAGAVFGNGITDYMSMADAGFDEIGNRGVMEAGMDVANRLKNEGKETYYKERADSNLEQAKFGVQSAERMQDVANNAGNIGFVTDLVSQVGNFGLKGGFSGLGSGGGGGLGNINTGFNGGSLNPNLFTTGGPFGRFGNF